MAGEANQAEASLDDMIDTWRTYAKEQASTGGWRRLLISLFAQSWNGSNPPLAAGYLSLNSGCATTARHASSTSGSGTLRASTACASVVASSVIGATMSAPSATACTTSSVFVPRSSFHADALTAGSCIKATLKFHGSDEPLNCKNSRRIFGRLSLV